MTAAAVPDSAASRAGVQRTTETHCPYCSLQCGMSVTAGDRPATLVPLDFPTNRGGLCSKGWSSVELLDHPERLLHPLVRAVPGDRTSPLVESTWDTALDRLVGAIRRTQRTHGRDAVGCFGGGSLTNEQAYQFGKFARVALRTSAIDYNGRFCMSSAAGAANRAFGLDRGMPFPLSDVAEADVVVLVGSNPADTMPPAMQYFDAGRERGAEHVVVDPRRTATARNAALHLQPLPGTDLALANGLLHIALAEGLVDEEYVAARTTGFDDVRAGVAAYWPDRVERLTGVPVADQRRTVFALARAERAIVLTARGAEQHRSGTDTASAWINLALALGLPGRPGSGWGTVTGQGNGQGGREHGQKADQLPGYRSLRDPAARAHVAAVWGVDPDELPMPGKSAFEMLDALGTDGGVRTLLVLASNVAVSAPDARRVVSRLRDLDFLAVSDFFLSETAELADVVLPSAMWAEEAGTMTNLEGRVIRRRRALDPPAGVPDDLQLLADARRPARRGAPVQRRPRDGVRGAAPGQRRGNGRLLRDQLRTGSTPSRASSGRARRRRPAPRSTPARRGCSPSASPPPTAGRGSSASSTWRPTSAPTPSTPSCSPPGGCWRSTSRARRPAARAACRSSRPPRARSCTPTSPAASASSPATSSSWPPGAAGRGSTRMVTDAIRPDVVFAPFHWGGGSSANALTDAGALDPTSGMPAFKVCAVAVTRVSGPARAHRAAPDAAQPLPRPHARRATPEPRTPTRSRPGTPRSTRVKSTPRFLQGVYPITGEGLAKPGPVDAALRYTVPSGLTAQALYFRGGNSTGELVYVLLLRDGEPMRWFPIGARGDVHVPLRVVEDLPGGTVVELHAAAPEGVTGELVVDLGLVEV